MSLVQDIAGRLIYALRKHSKRSATKAKLTFETLPMSTDVAFEGMLVRRLMSPPVGGDGQSTENLFDAWMYPHWMQEGDSYKDTMRLGGKPLAQYVGAGQSLGEQAVRMIFACANAEGATLTHDQSTILAHHGDHHYGLIDGAVHSRFCTGFKLDVDHISVLNHTYPVSIQSPSFASLYRESRAVGNGTTEALVAIYMGNPGFNWNRLASYAIKRDPPTRAQMDRWIKLLETKQDPIMALYISLVPRWVTPREFKSIAGVVGTRKLVLNQVEVARIISSIEAFFYKP